MPTLTYLKDIGNILRPPNHESATFLQIYVEGYSSRWVLRKHMIPRRFFQAILIFDIDDTFSDQLFVWYDNRALYSESAERLLMSASTVRISQAT